MRKTVVLFGAHALIDRALQKKNGSEEKKNKHLIGVVSEARVRLASDSCDKARNW